MDKLFLIVRKDLEPGQQAVQACHVLREFVSEHPIEDREWYQKSNTLVLLNLDDEEKLKFFSGELARAGIRFSKFFEPDIGNQLTALAVAPEGKSLCKRLPLALQ